MDPPSFRAPTHAAPVCPAANKQSKTCNHPIFFSFVRAQDLPYRASRLLPTILCAIHCVLRRQALSVAAVPGITRLLANLTGPRLGTLHTTPTHNSNCWSCIYFAHLHLRLRDHCVLSCLVLSCPGLCRSGMCSATFPLTQTAWWLHTALQLRRQRAMEPSSLRAIL